MQDPKHQKSRCPKCSADQGEPCTTPDGSIAEKVHYGRPYWSAKVDQSMPCKIVIRGFELDFDLQELTVVQDLLNRDTPLDPGDDRPVLFPGTNICADCGEPYPQPALIIRCQARHDRPKGRIKNS